MILTNLFFLLPVRQCEFGASFRLFACLFDFRTHQNVDFEYFHLFVLSVSFQHIASVWSAKCAEDSAVKFDLKWQHQTKRSTRSGMSPRQALLRSSLSAWRARAMSSRPPSAGCLWLAISMPADTSHSPYAFDLTLCLNWHLHISFATKPGLRK